VRVFKTKWFSRFAGKMGISDAKLRDIANGLAQGQWDADLGGDVYKVRVARSGKGKSGGLRTIVLFRKGEKAFFVYGLQSLTGATLRTGNWNSIGKRPVMVLL
jgi:hypothetical protein